MTRKIRAFADIGRAQGITTTASVAIVGALTSTASIQWYHIVYFTFLACLGHMALNTYIALGDITLDSHTYVPSRNPVTQGIITQKTALHFFYGATIVLTASLLLLFLFIEPIFACLAIMCDVIAYAWLIWYGWKGKHYLFSYDLSFSVSYTFIVLFGVFAINGLPTMYTWIFISVVILVATAFAQWENGLKDVDADRRSGVRSFAVISHVKSNTKLSLTHPYYIYGVILKTGFILFCFIAYMYYAHIEYLFFILLYGIPSQIFIMYRFHAKKAPKDHRRTILLDVAFTGILGFSVIIGRTGVIPILLLIIYLIAGYLIGSVFQEQCEFKFMRFSKIPQ
jgi:4-hydroxybenzoate polyprenyltransferase